MASLLRQLMREADKLELASSEFTKTLAAHGERIDALTKKLDEGGAHSDELAATVREIQQRCSERSANHAHIADIDDMIRTNTGRLFVLETHHIDQAKFNEALSTLMGEHSKNMAEMKLKVYGIAAGIAVAGPVLVYVAIKFIEHISK